MNISEPFVRRPVGTALLTVALALAGGIAYKFLPVAPLPEVEFPTISVNAGLPGANPETMASSVATPLERQFARIAGLTEMTSSSGLGSTSVTLQFGLDRNIDAAARDVQASINAARSQLPANLPGNPTYRKVNPADAPILILTLSSTLVSTGDMYDAASSIMQQKLSQIEGVGQVSVGGGALPAVRVELNPVQLGDYGLNLEDVRSMLASVNANRPKGAINGDRQSWSIETNDQLLKADQYRSLVVAFRNQGAVRLEDIATVSDSVEDLRALGLSQNGPTVQVIVFRQPAANIIETVDRVKALLPQFQSELPQAVKLTVAIDRSATIRASVRDVELTLVLSIGLVVLVVFLFLRNVRATLIPSVAVPVSLIATFGVMYLAGFSIDNLSLMAMTIATGFVVDDAIVVIENIIRYLEQGKTPFEAALVGAKEIGFTVISMSVSLVAVFIPILLMSGIVGRLFREFAIVLSVAIGVSLIVSLTTTPMMCAHLLRSHEGHGRFYQMTERAFDRILNVYKASLGWVIRHQPATALVMLGTVALTLYLYAVVPKGFFPQQDTGRLSGSILADQDSSFESMKQKLASFVKILSEDPDVEMVAGSTGGNARNSGRVYLSLKDSRKLSADQVIARLRPKLGTVPGATLYLQSVQDVRIGGRSSAAQYQFTLQGDDVKQLSEWAPKILERVRKLPGMLDVNTDQQDHGLAAFLQIDRQTASRLGITPQMLDDALYDAFGQRQVSTMYRALNQYHVIMEVAPKFWSSPAGLKDIYLRASDGNPIPLATFTKYKAETTPVAISHQGQFPSITISFNLAPGQSLGDAVTEIQKAQQDIGVPPNLHGTFQGTAQAFQDSLKNEPWLIAAALAAVYIVLGVLYESLIHPLTILSTLPSAGVGALLTLMLFHIELTIVALIGIILLIGIVKKNAIMMIDFALEAERKHGKSPEDAITEACLLRFRPITMTTMAALLGALPLAIGAGSGGELRQPLGLAIAGGLIFSQMFTLYTTPVVYLYLDRFRLRLGRLKQSLFSRGPREAQA